MKEREMLYARRGWVSSQEQAFGRQWGQCWIAKRVVWVWMRLHNGKRRLSKIQLTIDCFFNSTWLDGVRWRRQIDKEKSKWRSVPRRNPTAIPTILVSLSNHCSWALFEEGRRSFSFSFPSLLIIYWSFTRSSLSSLINSHPANTTNYLLLLLLPCAALLSSPLDQSSHPWSSFRLPVPLRINQLRNQSTNQPNY